MPVCGMVYQRILGLSENTHPAACPLSAHQHCYIHPAVLGWPEKGLSFIYETMLGKKTNHFEIGLVLPSPCFWSGAFRCAPQRESLSHLEMFRLDPWHAGWKSPGWGMAGNYHHSVPRLLYQKAFKNHQKVSSGEPSWQCKHALHSLEHFKIYVYYGT